MGIGPVIRGMLGRYERPVSEAYRGAFFSIDAMIDHMRRWRPTAQRILEVGCGEGAMTERLRDAYPDAEITAIDITPRVGRMYAGSKDRVRFLQCDVQSIAASQPGHFDLVVLVDVLHHVPIALRDGLLDAIRQTLAPGGAFMFKEWERTNTLIHRICYATDRWITGDRISYLTRDEMRQSLARSFGTGALADECRSKPWHNNLITLVCP
jgi:2-polyprenyl-6-hydroxyphenyl methylase/3-demethylubiquinone-9 3-methyltransferase